MYRIRPTTKFQKDLKRVQKRGYDLSLLLAMEANDEKEISGCLTNDIDFDDNRVRQFKQCGIAC